MTVPSHLTVTVCSGPVCHDQRDSGQLRARLCETIAARGLQDRIQVVDEVCLGHCLRGPNILVHEELEPGADRAGGPSGSAAGPRAVLYNRVTLADLDRVIDRHLRGGMAIRLF